MHSFKSLLRHVASFALVALLSQTGVSYAFSDVRTGTPYKRAIEALEERGIVEGYADGTFKEGNDINRAEFLKIVLGARGELMRDDPFRSINCFPDVPEGEWFTEDICLAKDDGIVAGYPDGLFHPEHTINFAEASKILSLAFRQSIEQYSPDWYEPYVRAIEGSKAIPPSIEKLDAKLTRGEMAEMLWRLTEQITTEETKAYLNVKYPEVTVNLAANTPQRAASCADLRAFAEEANRGGGMLKGMMLEDRAIPMMAPAMGAATKAAESAPSYSQTNVQVAGVDEADIVKTDGTYLYVVANGNVSIVQASPASTMKLLSTIDLQSEGFTPQDLYLAHDRLIVIGSRWQNIPYIMDSTGSPQVEERMIAPDIWPPYPYVPPKVETRTYDVRNHSEPKLERTVTLDGSVVSSRRIDHRLYLIVNQPLYFGGPIPLKGARETDVLPRFADSRREGGSEQPVARCSDVIILPRVPAPEYLTVAMIPLDNANADVRREVVLGNAQNVYASLENLYVATTEWLYYWDVRRPESSEKTNVYRFAFTSDGIAMESQGSVPGHILNQFSMDEDKNTFRIATTSNNWSVPNGMTNNLYVLNRDLENVGAIEDIAPGEQIYSVRFLGDRAYMVTFRTIDPLFVIDTSDPRSPRILGKLKIPGFSNYLHPYDSDHILGFGKEAVESKDGTFAWQQGMKIALFDVSDVEHPKELHRVVIGDRGTDSQALSNHKALFFEKGRNLLAFPVSVFELTQEQKQSGDPGSSWGTQVFQGAYVYDLSLQDGFTLRGTITHYSEEDRLKAGDDWYAYGRDVERIVRIGDSLLTLSQGSIQSHDEKTVEREGEVTLP